MRLADIKHTYPAAGRLIQRLTDEGIDARACEGQTPRALARIDSGETTERDLRLLMTARTAVAALPGCDGLRLMSETQNRRSIDIRPHRWQQAAKPFESTVPAPAESSVRKEHWMLYGRTVQ